DQRAQALALACVLLHVGAIVRHVGGPHSASTGRSLSLRRSNEGSARMSSISTDVERNEQGEWGSETKGEGHYADVNGIKLYYEIHGTGRPLILLHGGLGAIEMFGPNLTILAKRHQVIGVDLQAHGRTADIDRPIRTELMAEDIAALIKHMK